MEAIIYKSKIIRFILIIVLIIYMTYISVELLNLKINLSMKIIKYISILLCFLITLLLEGNEINKLDMRLLQLGMLLTTIADLFLVILDYHNPGVITFSIVQIIYIFRYTQGKFMNIVKPLIKIFIIITSIYILINRYIFTVDLTILLGLFYSICILISLSKSIEAGRKGKYPNLNKNMIIWGMILFVLCDINVALTRIEIFKEITSSLIWVFYLPSQVLLSLSGYKL